MPVSPVMLSAAKNLSPGVMQILRCAQHDRSHFADPFPKTPPSERREGPTPCSRILRGNTASDSERSSHLAHRLLVKNVLTAMPGKRRHSSTPRDLLLYSTTARWRPSGSWKAARVLGVLTMLAAAAIQATMPVTMASQPPICTRTT